jgi:hypothetical protein
MRLALFLFIVCASVRSTLAQHEASAEPPFRMEVVQHMGLSFAGPRNCWAIVDTGQGPKVAYIDALGSMYEHRLVSWDTTSPAGVSVREGSLFVTYQGRVFRLAQHFRYEQRVVVAPVTRVHQGLIFQWPCTQPELIQVPVLVGGSRWMESLPPAPTSAPPSQSSELLPPISPSKESPERLIPPKRPNAVFAT